MTCSKNTSKQLPCENTLIASVWMSPMHGRFSNCWILTEAQRDNSCQFQCLICSFVPSPFVAFAIVVLVVGEHVENSFAFALKQYEFIESFGVHKI